MSDDQRFSEWLRAGAEADWQRAITHRFVEELFTGSVPGGALRTYLVQDHQFVDRFTALLGEAVAAADLTASRMVLARQLGVVGGIESTYFQRCFDELGVTEPERNHPRLHPATRAFNDLMDRARESRDYARCLTVLAVAEWLYLDWAQRAPSTPPASFLHREWIKMHNEPAFVEWVDWLRAELDRLGGELDEQHRAQCRELFAAATRLEADFFDAAYE